MIKLKGIISHSEKQLLLFNGDQLLCLPLSERGVIIGSLNNGHFAVATPRKEDLVDDCIESIQIEGEGYSLLIFDPDDQTALITQIVIDEIEVSVKGIGSVLERAVFPGENLFKRKPEVELESKVKKAYKFECLQDNSYRIFFGNGRESDDSNPTPSPANHKNL